MNNCSSDVIERAETSNAESEEDDEPAFDPTYPTRRGTGSVASVPDSVDLGSGEALLSIERNIANLERSILNHRKYDDNHDSSSQHQVGKRLSGLLGMGEWSMSFRN